MNQLYKCLSVDSSELAYVAHLVPTIDNGIISIDVVTHDAMQFKVGNTYSIRIEQDHVADAVRKGFNS